MPNDERMTKYMGRKFSDVAQIFNLSVSLGIVSLRDDFAGGWYLAKRMECVELAPAFVRRGWSKSASKLDALHALRAIRLRPCRAALYRRFAIGRAFERGCARR